MRSLTSRWNHQDSIKVEWNLGKRCNFDCGYCPVEIHDNHSPHKNISLLTHVVDELCEIGKPLRISLTGGEPCIHPDITEFLEYLQERVSWVNVTTNGTRSYDWYLEQPANHWVFSLHFDNKHWERCLNTVVDFHRHSDIPMHVNLMAHHEHMENVKTAHKHLNYFSVPTVVRRVRWTEKHDWFNDLKYHSKDLEWILSTESTAEPNVVDEHGQLYHANDIIKTHNNQFEGWTCNAGLESLMINWDGEVHRATCRVGGSLGNIYDETFVPPENPIICTRKWCTCAADIPLTKSSI